MYTLTINSKIHGPQYFRAADHGQFAYVWHSTERGEWKQCFNGDGSAVMAASQQGLEKAARKWWRREREWQNEKLDMWRAVWDEREAAA